MNILIISGHPNLGQSVANKTILEEVQKQLPTAKVRKLDGLYPDWQFDIETEQNALVKSDVIIWQYPLHWYTTPALMKKYIDDIFTFGFAYGPNGSQLQDKKLIISFTAGGQAEAYIKGEKTMPMEDFLAIHQQTANFSGLNFIDSVYTTGLLYIPGVHTDVDLKRIQTEAKNHANRLVNLIKSL